MLFFDFPGYSFFFQKCTWIIESFIDQSENSIKFPRIHKNY